MPRLPCEVLALESTTCARLIDNFINKLKSTRLLCSQVLCPITDSDWMLKWLITDNKDYLCTSSRCHLCYSGTDTGASAAYMELSGYDCALHGHSGPTHLTSGHTA
eukprot:6459182-Amphidinium_carterae.3